MTKKNHPSLLKEKRLTEKKLRQNKVTILLKVKIVLMTTNNI